MFCRLADIMQEACQCSLKATLSAEIYFIEQFVWGFLGTTLKQFVSIFSHILLLIYEKNIHFCDEISVIRNLEIDFLYIEEEIQPIYESYIPFTRRFVIISVRRLSVKRNIKEIRIKFMFHGGKI